MTFVLAVLERPPPTTGAVGDDGDGTEEVAEVHLQWRRLVLTAVQALRGVVLGQPNTKKVRHPCATASMRHSIHAPTLPADLLIGTRGGINYGIRVI